MRKKFQVFLSSTYRDLVEERRLAIEEILKADCIPVGMELFPASHDDPLQYIRKIIDESDYYLLIVAGRYGSEHEDKSFTEHEFDYAQAAGKKIIAFVHENTTLLQAAKVDAGEKQKKLRRFKQKLEKAKLVVHWNHPHQLSEKILHSLHEIKQSHPADGWIKANPSNLRLIAQNRNKGLLQKAERLRRQLEALQASSTTFAGSIRSEHQNLSRLVQARHQEIDKEANELFGSVLISSRTGHEIRFSSAKIADSLSLLGIPLHVCCEVIEKCLGELRIIKRKSHQLSTSDIRRAVAEVLYRIEPTDVSPKRVQIWADSYIRKYGNPSKQISVLDDAKALDAGVVPLSFHLVRENVLSDVAKAIFPDDYQARLTGVRREDRDTFAEEIIRHVKHLEIYRIHYSSLVTLAKEIALSPPHPWFVEIPKTEEAVRYDLERAAHHAGKLRQMLRTEHLREGFYSINECIHHSCSGILATYGVFLGCGYMAPFYNLLHHLVEHKNGRESDAFAYSEIRHLFDEFPAFGYSIQALTADVENLKQKLKLQDISEWDVASDMASRAIALSDALYSLVRHRLPSLV